MTSGVGGSAKHTMEGQWHTSSKDKNGKTFHDVNGPKEEVIVGPLESQDEFESRKLWALVAKGIREGDYDTAAKEKSKIEVKNSCLPGEMVLTRGRGTERPEAAEKG